MQTQSDLRRQKKKNIVFFPLAVAVWAQQQFSSKVHFKCRSSEEGPFASSLLGHEFSHVRVVPTQIRWSPNSIRQMHWDEKFVHWEIGLKFRDFEVGILDWDCETKIYNLKFIESLLLLGEKTQEWKFRICIPPYYPVHIMVGICPLLSIFPLSSLKKMHSFESQGAWYPSLLFPSDSWIAHWNWDVQGPKSG